MDKKITLSELNQQVKTALLAAFPSTVWVIAEISECNENRNGHCYLELVEKDDNKIIARSRATIWSYTFRMLKPYFETTTGQVFGEGIKVLLQVTVEFHEAFGLSLNIKDIDPAYTVGDMAVQRKIIIDRLKNEGVFEMNKELELPLVPQKIAVISSESAAGYQDFMNQIENNEYGFVFYTKLFQAKMQGAETVPSIIRALDLIFKHEDFFDAVVIIRGGGATADLSSFDNYDLALNITQFPLPVLTGIGHEKDDTVIDFVAHTRLKTPTAVAEFLVKGMVRFYEKVVEYENYTVQTVKHIIHENKIQLERIGLNLQLLVSEYINEKQMALTQKANGFQKTVSGFSFGKKYELSRTRNRLKNSISIWQVVSKNKINQKNRLVKRLANESSLKQKLKIMHLQDSFKNSIKGKLAKEKERFHLNENALRLLNPENVLNRGFTLTLQDGKIIKKVKALNVAKEMETHFADGKIKSKIVD